MEKYGYMVVTSMHKVAAILYLFPLMVAQALVADVIVQPGAWLS